MPTITHKRRKRQPKKEIKRTVDNSKIYNSQDWRKASIAFRSIRENQFCVICFAKGVYTVAQEVDHIKPITQGGDIWDRSNWQPICTIHHRQKSGREAHPRFNQ